MAAEAEGYKHVHMKCLVWAATSLDPTQPLSLLFNAIQLIIVCERQQNINISQESYELVRRPRLTRGSLGFSPIAPPILHRER